MLHAAFRWAVAEEMIERDPTDLAKPPPYRKPEARYLDLEDVRRLRELVAGHGLEGAVILEPGRPARRRGDLHARWGDLADNVLHVRGSSWGGKTKTGRTRSLTLPAGEVAALRAFRAREAERLLRVGVRIDDRTTILTDGFGEPLKPAVPRAQTFTIWACGPAASTAPTTLSGTPPRACMLASGTDVRTVAGRLGHASSDDHSRRPTRT